jgi:hypothetical protein
MGYFEALYYLRKKRSCVCPNMGFARQLQVFEKEVAAIKDKYMQVDKPLEGFHPSTEV